MTDIEYCDLALKDGFEAVYHKIRTGYEIQNEVRFAVICPEKPEHFELELENNQELRFSTFSLTYGKHILVELSKLEFDESKEVPIRFSSEIKYYESDEIIEK